MARRDLIAAGVTSRELEWRLRLGRLHRVYPGVYAAGHPGGGRDADLMAAWLFGGSRSVLTHRGAAQFRDLGYFREIDLTAPGSRRSNGRLVFHRGEVPQREWVWERGLRVSTPARMLLELCAVVPEPRMRRVFTEAEVQGLVDLPALRAILSAHPRQRGARLLRRLSGLGPELAEGTIRSRLEGRFRHWVAARQLPRGETNVLVEVGGEVYEADYLWRRQRVIVEIDGREAHDNAERFESDRARDLRLSAYGWRPVRVTKRLMDDPERLHGDLRRLLGLD